jgi:hypothetical protein
VRLGIIDVLGSTIPVESRDYDLRKLLAYGNRDPLVPLTWLFQLHTMLLLSVAYYGGKDDLDPSTTIFDIQCLSSVFKQPIVSTSASTCFGDHIKMMWAVHSDNAMDLNKYVGLSDTMQDCLNPAGTRLSTTRINQDPSTPLISHLGY